MTTHPDIFTNVHKGIRAALFEACIRLGRADDDDPELPETLAFAASALHFVVHHGENEDVLLLPLLSQRRPDLAHRLADAHRDIDARLASLKGAMGTVPVASLYLEFTGFTAAYLMHMLEEERADAAMREAIAEDDIASVGRGSVARTAPADQRLMLGFMLPAMPARDAAVLLGKLPSGLAADLSAALDERRTMPAMV